MHWPLKGKVQNLVRGGPGGVGVPPKWTVSVTGVFEPFPMRSLLVKSTTPCEWNDPSIHMFTSFLSQCVDWKFL